MKDDFLATQLEWLYEPLNVLRSFQNILDSNLMPNHYLNNFTYFYILVKT